MSDLPPGTLYVRFSRDSDGDYRYRIYEATPSSEYSCGDYERKCATGYTRRWVPGAESRCVRAAKRRLRKLIKERERIRKSQEMQLLKFVYDPRRDCLTRDFTEVEKELDLA